MDQSGRLPAAVGVGHEKRWLQSTIVAWIADGCPGRGEWEAKSKRPKLFDFPFALELFGFTLSKRCYEDVFEPEHKDMVAKFECAHGDRFRTAPCRWCLNIAFAIRTGAIVVRCLRRPILRCIARVPRCRMPGPTASAGSWRGCAVEAVQARR